MQNKTLGLFGDSYAATNMNKKDSWGLMLSRNFQTLECGKNGSNLFYAIDCWHKAVEEHGTNYFDYAVFTFTWHERLYSEQQHRNNYFCVPKLGAWDLGTVIDQEVVGQQDLEDFKKTHENYYRFLFDSKWSLFRHELEIQYILDLPQKFPNTKFIFLPNTELSREISKKRFTNGVLLDFAFETISNLEPDSPGIMPIQDSRAAHLNLNNHVQMYKNIMEVINNYDNCADQIVPVDLGKFDVKLP